MPTTSPIFYNILKILMYYRSPGNLNPILPRSDLTPAVVADNFDERTVINDDLNMNGYFIYNLKDPEDDQDAVTKIYVDTKQYNINSANIMGNLPLVPHK